MQEAQFYTIEDNEAVKCDLCHHHCLINNGQAGACHARKNIDGRLFTLVYGYPVALNVDPVEKKPLFHFLPGSLTFSLGTYGCNFHCANCQNWDISQATNIDALTKNMTYYPPELIVEEAIEEKCPSISYTYNEPTVFAEYALDIMKTARNQGLKNIWVSNGFTGAKALKSIIPYLDAVNVDLKSMDDEFYIRNCGARLAPVLENLKTYKQSNVHLEITTLIIPTLSDHHDMLERIARFIADELGTDTPWHLSKFSPEISWKLKDLPSTGLGNLHDAYYIGKTAGLKYVYIGNIPGDQKENTYCSMCGALAIQRFGFEIERYDKFGKCPKCGDNLEINE